MHQDRLTYEELKGFQQEANAYACDEGNGPTAIPAQADIVLTEFAQAKGQPRKGEQKRSLTQGNPMQRIGDENENDDKKLNKNEPLALPPPMPRAGRVPMRCRWGCDRCCVVATSEFSH